MSQNVKVYRTLEFYAQGGATRMSTIDTDDSATICYWRPETDDTGALYFGDGTKDFDVRFTLGSAAVYAEFNVGNTQLALVGVDLDTDSPLNIGSSGSEVSYTAGTPVFTLYATSANTGSTNAEPFYVYSEMTGTSGSGGRSRFHTYKNVTGGTNTMALKAYMEYGDSGRNAGLGAAFCAELDMPNADTGSGGVYSVLELEYTAGGTSLTTAGSLAGNYATWMYLNTSGDSNGDFDSNGFFMSVQGLTAGAGKLLSADNQTLKMGIGTATTRYLLMSQSANILDLNVTTVGATGRVAKLYGSVAAPNFGDGYGMVEIDATFTGTYAGISAALSAWVNVTGTGAVGANIVAAQNNGIYADSGANTSSIVIFGMRAQAILTDAPTVLAPFSINTSNRAITALFEMNANPDVGYQANSGTSGPKVGDVPLFCDAAGQQYFVRIYSARG